MGLRSWVDSGSVNVSVRVFSLAVALASCGGNPCADPPYRSASVSFSNADGTDHPPHTTIFTGEKYELKACGLCGESSVDIVKALGAEPSMDCRDHLFGGMTCTVSAAVHSGQCEILTFQPTTAASLVDVDLTTPSSSTQIGFALTFDCQPTSCLPCGDLNESCCQGTKCSQTDVFDCDTAANRCVPCGSAGAPCCHSGDSSGFAYCTVGVCRGEICGSPPVPDAGLDAAPDGQSF